MPRRSDPEYGDTLKELMKPQDEQDPRRGFERVEKDPPPGSDAYLRRRQREGEEDLRNAPRRPR